MRSDPISGPSGTAGLSGAGGAFGLAGLNTASAAAKGPVPRLRLQPVAGVADQLAERLISPTELECVRDPGRRPSPLGEQENDARIGLLEPGGASNSAHIASSAVWHVAWIMLRSRSGTSGRMIALDAIASD